MPQSAAVAELAPISALRAERAHAAMPAPLDPFDEQGPRRHGVRKQVLGASFHFESDSPALLALVEAVRRGCRWPSRRRFARMPLPVCCAG